MLLLYHIGNLFAYSCFICDLCFTIHKCPWPRGLSRSQVPITRGRRLHIAVRRALEVAGSNHSRSQVEYSCFLCDLCLTIHKRSWPHSNHRCSRILIRSLFLILPIVLYRAAFCRALASVSEDKLHLYVEYILFW